MIDHRFPGKNSRNNQRNVLNLWRSVAGVAHSGYHAISIALPQHLFSASVKTYTGITAQVSFPQLARFTDYQMCVILTWWCAPEKHATNVIAGYLTNRVGKHACGLEHR